MHFHFEILNVTSNFSVWKAGSQYRDNAGRNWSIGFLISPYGNDRLVLGTGEVFQNRRYAQLHKTEEKNIIGSLTVTVEDDDHKEGKYSRLRYYAGSISEGRLGNSHLFFDYYLPEPDFAFLHSHIVAGRFPETAMLDLAGDAVQIYLEPQGSYKKWDNSKNPEVQILGLDFEFEYSGE